jgi:hypothetical protein
MDFVIYGCIVCGSEDHQTGECDKSKNYKDLPQINYENYRIKCIICGEKHEFEQCPKYSSYKIIKEFYFKDNDINNDIEKIVKISNFRYDSLPCMRYITYINKHNETISTRLTSIMIYLLCKQYEFPSDSDRYFLYNDIYPITKYLSFLEELKTLNI